MLFLVIKKVFLSDLLLAMLNLSSLGLCPKIVLFQDSTFIIAVIVYLYIYHKIHLVLPELKNGEVFDEVDVLELVHRVHLLDQGTSQVQHLCYGSV